MYMDFLSLPLQEGGGEVPEIAGGPPLGPDIGSSFSLRDRKETSSLLGKVIDKGVALPPCPHAPSHRSLVMQVALDFMNNRELAGIDVDPEPAKSTVIRRCCVTKLRLVVRDHRGTVRDQFHRRSLTYMCSRIMASDVLGEVTCGREVRIDRPHDGPADPIPRQLQNSPASSSKRRLPVNDRSVDVDRSVCRKEGSKDLRCDIPPEQLITGGKISGRRGRGLDVENASRGPRMLLPLFESLEHVIGFISKVALENPMVCRVFPATVRALHINCKAPARKYRTGGKPA
jgi:hypothetical protein